MRNRFHPVIARPSRRSNPETKTGSPLTPRVLAMTLMLFCASLPAAAQVPGDPCATAQQYKVNGGPETSGVVHMMVCEGGTWKSIVSSNAAGEVTKIGNQTCASDDYFKYDGTKFICTTAGGAALSGITAATGGNSINSGDHAQTWNWQLTTADKDAFTFTENTASTATGHSSVLKAATLATSTATPFMITNLGAANSFRVNDETGDADASPFVIAADGKVGIGTASPETELHLLNPASYTTLTIGNPNPIGNNASDGYIKLYGENTGTVYTGTISMQSMNLFLNAPNSVTTQARSTVIRGTTAGNAVLDTLILMAEDTDSAASNGIGASIVFNLENSVNGTYRDAAKIEGVFDDVDDNSKDGSLRFYTMGPNAASGTTTTTERMRIDSAGRVGIGTASPAATLDVAGPVFVNGDSNASEGDIFIGGGGWPYNIGVGWGGGYNDLYINAIGTGGGTADFRNLGILNGKSNMVAFYHGSTKRFSVGGDDQTPDAMLEVIKDSTSPLMMLSSAAANNGDLMIVDASGNVGIGTATPASKFVVAPPATEAVASAATITANACGTIKQITSTGNVTTNTTNTFTAPTASYAGCCMTIINVDTADTITLDANTHFKTIGGANQALDPSDAVLVCSNGTNWYQIGAVSGNQ